MSFSKLKNSFRYAIQGICSVFKTEQNIRIHTIATVVVITSAFMLNFKPWEWIAVIIAICFVIVAEMFNTAVEKTVDLVTGDYHPLAKSAKDIAAGAVLFSSFCAVIIGVIIYWPYLNKMVATFGGTK